MIVSGGLILRMVCCTMAYIGALIFMSGSAVANPILQHNLTLRLEPPTNRLEAVDRIQVSRLTKDHLVFSLAKHLTVRQVTLNGASVDFRFRRGRLYIPIPQEQSESLLVIEYGGRYEDKVDVQPLNTDNPGFGVTGTIQPQGTLLLAGAGWYPRGPKADNTTYTVTVNAPQGVLAVITGRALGHTKRNGRTLSRWAVDKPLEGLSLAAGTWKLATKKFGAVTAATYFSKPLQRLSSDYLDAVGRYLKLYESRFGPYPFERFAVVENFFPTGYGFASFTLLGRRVLQLPFIIHTSLGHEVAHCWWGNGVLVDGSLGNWSEGLTTYVADYLYKELKGEGEGYRRQWLRNYAGLVNDRTDFPLSDFTHRTDPASKTVGYDKAAMVFHMLRQMVGEEKFWQTLRDVYKRYLFQAISWRHWQAAFEEAAGRSLEGFFSQWVYRAGAPNLVVSDVAVTPAKSGFLIQGQIEQSRPYFDVTIDAMVQTKSDIQRKTLNVSGARTPFSWQVNHMPKKLTLDPDANLFRRLAPSEIPPTINAVKGAPSVTIVVAQDLDKGWINIAKRLATALGLKDAAIGREAQFPASHLGNTDLIWIGQPQDRRWLPGEPASFSLGTQQVELAGQSYLREAVSFFGVFDHPLHKDRVTALFLPQSLADAKVLSTKIPHYGKYSYLVFKSSRNRVKGTWEADASPLTIQWKDNDFSRTKRGAL